MSRLDSTSMEEIETISISPSDLRIIQTHKVPKHLHRIGVKGPSLNFKKNILNIQRPLQTAKYTCGIKSFVLTQIPVYMCPNIV